MAWGRSVGIGGSVLALVLFLWKVPEYQVAHRFDGVWSQKIKFDSENEARKTLAQIVGGLFVLAGLYVGWRRLQTAESQQITERFTRAIDQIGATDQEGKPRLEVRLGGIYALERIMHDSERDHRTIVEVLVAYVRENAPRATEDTSPYHQLGRGERESHPGPRTDVQAAVTVIGRRPKRWSDDGVRMDLGGLYLRKIDLRGARFAEAVFAGSDLSGGKLDDADLSRASLFEATLTGAILDGASLCGASLHEASMAEVKAGILAGGADLSYADLAGANLRESTFLESDLRYASLDNADLRKGTFMHVNLSGATFHGATLAGAVIKSSGVITSQLLQASDPTESRLDEAVMRELLRALKERP